MAALTFFNSNQTRRDEIYEEFRRLFGKEHALFKTITFINDFSEKTLETIGLPVSKKRFEELQYLAKLYLELAEEDSNQEPNGEGFENATDDQWNVINSQGNLTQ